MATRTSFFPSLAETLHHILAVDLYYIAALHGEADMERQWDETPKRETVAELAAAQAVGRRALHRPRRRRSTPTALDDVVEMDRGDGRIQRDRRGNVIAHLLNHQVHHRGQAHAMLAGTAVRAAAARRVPDAERGASAQRRRRRARLDRGRSVPRRARLGRPRRPDGEHLPHARARAAARPGRPLRRPRGRAARRWPGKQAGTRRARCCGSSARPACSA